MKNGDIDPILRRVHVLRNFDFRNYKKATLQRRIEKRMKARNCARIKDYTKLLDHDADEIQNLVSSMLIKVTSFLRDPEVWDQLSKTILPELIAAKRDDELRVWCAGCSTGEEAFTLAILLAETLGAAFPTFRVKIFGTDVDEGAIAFARRAVYPESSLETLPKEIIERWFTRSPEGWAVRQELRRIVVFGANNLVSHAPISRLDLISCRNVFIYLDAELQKRVLARFHFALRREGVLVLGKSELIPFASTIFEPADLSKRIYRKDVRRSLGTSERLTELLSRENMRRQGNSAIEPGEPSNAINEFYRDAIDSMHMPVIVTSRDGTVNLWNVAAGELWNRTEQDVMGKKLTSLGLQGLSGELLVERTTLVTNGGSTHEVAEGVIEIPTRGTRTYLRAHVYPLRTSNRDLGLVYLVEDSTTWHAAEEAREVARKESRVAVEQLREWTEEQQAASEELETTNEELQSANEELQTTNEELQSTNEELETTNEELESANVELDTTNRELASRTQQMNMMSFLQRAIIRSISAAIVVLDPAGRITTWNLSAERLLGLPELEALGQTLWTLHVPALERAVIARIRKAIEDRNPLRDLIAVALPGGAIGNAKIAAFPLIENDQNLGSIVLFESTAIPAASEAATSPKSQKPPKAPHGRTAAKMSRSKKPSRRRR